MKQLFVATLVLIQVGCAGTMGNMSADQLTAMAKDKNSAVGCTDYTGAGGKFSALFMNQEKIVNTGGGEATVKCAAGEVTFRDAGKSAPVVVPAPTAVK